MSASRKTFAAIAETAPDFRPGYQTFLADGQGEDIPWYVAMGQLARYIVEAYQQGRTEHFQGLFSAVEFALQNGGEEIQTLVCVGLLEGIQNIALSRNLGLGAFRPWLGPRSLAAWEEIDWGWKG
jgi:hypothetical protein